MIYIFFADTDKLPGPCHGVQMSKRETNTIYKLATCLCLPGCNKFIIKGSAMCPLIKQCKLRNIIAENIYRKNGFLEE